MSDFGELAEGARALHVHLGCGDIAVRVAESSGWTLEWSGDVPPLVERDGHVLRLRQRDKRPWRRLDVRLTLPPGVEDVELRTGSGRIEADGINGRAQLKTGNGVLTLRAAGGTTEAHSGNGAVEIAGYDGRITVTSGNGPLRVARLHGEATLKTGNGRVEVRDTEGQVRVTTGNGDVVLSGVGGEVDGTTGHGDVEIEAPRELALRATTGYGSFHVEGGSARALSLKTATGEIRCSAALRRGRYALESAMGAIVVALPATLGARVEAQTSFGHIHSDFPLVQVGRSGPMGFGGARMVGSIGAGDPVIDLSLRTVKGEITLRRAGAGEPVAPPVRPADAPTPPPRPADTPAPPPDDGEAPAAAETPDADANANASSPQLAILEALARGELSPAEAEDLLTQVP